MSKTAVVVVDMQRDFVVKGAPIECYGARDIIPNIRELLKVARGLGIPIIFMKEIHRPDEIDFGIELEKEPKHCIEGSEGGEIVDELSPKEGDYIVIKRRYSAFYETDLEILLKGLKVDRLVLTGVATNICVRGTVQDAKQKDYHIVVPRECVAGTDAKANEANLRDINNFYGDVLPLSEVITYLRKEKT